MSLESATRISELVASNPPGTDPVSQGDDHIRMIKAVLQSNAIKSEIGQSATPANNFTLDASADDGTMKLARGSGQDIMTVDAGGIVAFPQMVRTWQDVVGARSFGIDYVNNENGEADVAIWIGSSAGTSSARLLINGLAIGIAYAIAGQSEACIFATIPKEATYRLNVNGGTPTIGSWKQLS